MWAQRRSSRGTLRPSGTPTAYAVYVYRLYPSAGQTKQEFVASFMTTETSLQFPEDLLVDGQTYVLIVAAIENGDHGGTAAPSRIAPPHAFGSVLTGMLVPGNPGFLAPTVPLKAWARSGGTWVEQGPANLACLNTPDGGTPLAVDVTVTGTVTDFQDGTTLSGVDVAAFENQDVLGTPVATAVSGSDGSYSLVLSSGQGPRFSYRLRQTNYLDTYRLNETYNPDTANQTTSLSPIAVTSANAITAAVGVQRSTTRGLLIGGIRDCDGNQVSGAIATLSSSSCAGVSDCEPSELAGVQTYYTSTNGLPARATQQASTSELGSFVVMEIPPTPAAYLQVWGYRDQAAVDAGNLELIAEIKAPVVADTVIKVDLDPLRTP